ncbi:MAG TPA: ABC-F family ATP-binding cassette domain-containing protein [Pyrinomonadaceae bacterium]|nr:ABC-F family ATP-binding cassette domain-containing protein [Pyrinomonadaceae bacterium]
MLFRLSDVHKAYGSQDVLRGAALQVNPGEHVGLVGRNGAGKTTIFRLVSGEESPDRGDVVRARGVRLGLLAQHVHFESGSTVHESALAAFGHLQQIEHEMHELEHRMAETGDDLEKVLERYSQLQHDFEREGGFEYAAKAESILLGLGFPRETWSLETEKLSGGQQNRLGLARLLLAEPDVLLLDEPTNHLDVNAVEWLEEYLQTYASGFVIISHDRYFLDRVCRRIVDLENGKAFSYNGNYSDYLIEREARREAQQRAYDNQQQLIAKTEEFIRRNIAGQKTKQAKSRRKMLEKLDRIDAVRLDQSSGDFRLQSIERAGNHVLTVTEATIGYPDKVLARDISFILRRGECLGIIGPNGSGKTTFLKTVLKKTAPLEGEIRWGTKVQVGYYAQQLDDLDDRNEVIMELRRVAPPSATAGELRSFLAKFLFTGDDVYKKVQDLSGGEKGRLALAKLIYSHVNVLVLDEPTNHLDIPSREALEEALDAYKGTILTISHDRYFLDRIATQVLALDGQGLAEHYEGDYTEYHDWKAARLKGGENLEEPYTEGSEGDLSTRQNVRRDGSEARRGVRQAQTKVTRAKGAGKKNKTAPSESPQVKVIKKPRSPEVIEGEISELEKRLARLSEEMALPEVARDITRLVAVNDDYERTNARLADLMSEWERAETAGSSQKR